MVAVCRWRAERPRVGGAQIGPEGSEFVLFQRQLGLLLWKDFTQKARNKKSTILYFLLPASVFFLVWIFYQLFNSGNNGSSSGMVELFLIPFAFIIVLQLTASSIVSEKSLRLLEAMRMMGLRELPYWASYLLADGVIMNFLLSLWLSILAIAMGLFQEIGETNNFAALWAFLFCYSLALTTLAFVIAAVLDAPQTAGQVSFAVSESMGRLAA